MDFWEILALSQAGKALKKASDNSLLHFKGSVLTYEDLPHDAEQGDVYHVDEDGAEYAWTGEAWESLGPIIVVDDALSDTSENPVQNKVVKNAIDAKLATSNVYNGLDKSVSGFALDARQGKVLWDIISSSVNPSFASLKRLLDGGYAQSLYPVGSQIIDKWKNTSGTEYSCPWDIVHYDESGNMYCKWHYAGDAVQFDAPEALFYANEVIPAGQYYITVALAYGTGWVANSHINFTLTADMDVGDQFVVNTNTDNKTDPTNGRTWNVYAKGSTTSKQTGTTSDSSNGTELGSTSSSGTGYTNGIVNAPQRVVHGYNRWSQSAMRQYLNSNAVANAWWVAQNDWDRPPSQLSSVRGFLAGCSNDLLSVLEPVTVTTALNTVEGASSTSETTTDKIFLPSLQEMYIVPQLADVEEEDWDYYKALAQEAGLTGKFQQSSTYPILITYDIANISSAVYVRMRSASRGYASYVWLVYSSGTVSNGTATSAYRPSPACKILKSV